MFEKKKKKKIDKFETLTKFYLDFPKDFHVIKSLKNLFYSEKSV